MSIVIEALAREPYRVIVKANQHTFFSDVTPEKGGQDTAPDPHQLFFGAWGACTAMTIEMYAQRKGWPLESVQVSLDESRASGRTPVIRKEILVTGPLTDEQMQALERVAEKCPINQLILGEKQVTTCFNASPIPV